MFVIEPSNLQTHYGTKNCIEGVSEYIPDKAGDILNSKNRILNRSGVSPRIH